MQAARGRSRVEELEGEVRALQDAYIISVYLLY